MSSSSRAPVPVLLMVRSLTDGGSERQLTEIARALDRSRWTPHVGCFHDQGRRADDLRASQVPIVRFPVRSFASFSAIQGIWQLRQYVRHHGIELIHSFDVPMNIFGVAAGRLTGCRTVLSSQRAFRSLSLIKPRELQLLRVSDRLVHGTVVNCRALERHLIEDEGVAPNQIHLCYNGLDLNRFTGARECRPKALEGASLVIGCLCVLRPEKGLSTLVDAFAAVRHRKEGMKLVLVGSGPLAEPLREQAVRLGIDAAVHFQPATADVARWLGAMDIFVLPSLTEALSNSLMEAMACGCAAVASRVGGNPELVIDGETGLLFDPGDRQGLTAALERLLSSEELRCRLAATGNAQVMQRFTLAAAAERMGEIYYLALRPH